MLELQRADADEVAGRSDHRGAAPMRMGRGGEDRLVEDILPVAGEFLLRDDPGRDRAGAPAGARDDDALAKARGLRIAERQRRQVEPAERLHEAEARRLVVAEDVALHGAAVAGHEPDRSAPR